MLVVHNAGTRTGLVLRECALQSQSCDSDSDIARQVGKRATGGKGVCVRTVQSVPFALCTASPEWNGCVATRRLLHARYLNAIGHSRTFLIPRRLALAFECYNLLRNGRVACLHLQSRSLSGHPDIRYSGAQAASGPCSIMPAHHDASGHVTPLPLGGRPARCARQPELARRPATEGRESLRSFSKLRFSFNLGLPREFSFRSSSAVQKTRVSVGVCFATPLPAPRPPGE
jgi:hypothetical protein